MSVLPSEPNERPPSVESFSEAEIGPLDRRLAPLMFFAALAWLMFLAGILQELAGGAIYPTDTRIYWWGLPIAWALLAIEPLWHYFAQSPRWRQNAWSVLLPPLRLAGRDHSRGNAVWLPGMGWQPANLRLQRRLERRFHAPMIVFSLLVLPILLIDLVWSRQLEAWPQLKFLLDSGTSFIWLAFTIEFSILISITPRRWEYCKTHWVDAVIILLPFIAILRVFRVMTVLRVQQVAKASRTMHLRGLAMRAYRGLLAFDLLGRWLKPDPKRRLQLLRTLIAEKESELAQLHGEREQLEQLLDGNERLANAPVEQTRWARRRARPVFPSDRTA